MDLRKNYWLVGALAAAAAAGAVGIGISTSRAQGPASSAPPSPELAAMLGATSQSSSSDPKAPLAQRPTDPTTQQPAHPSGLSTLNTQPPTLNTQLPQIRIYVLGAVKNPGVYTIPSESRVQESLTAAGGPSAAADLEAINLADFLKDGEQVVFPAKPAHPRTASAPSTVAKRATGALMGRYPIAQVAAQRPPASNPGPTGLITSSPHDPITSSPSTSGVVNINTATGPELEALPGVGPSIAAAILQHRKQHGPFARIEDIQDVRGIGEKKFAVMRDRLSVR